ncbi:MAG: hypothetical protein WA584_07690 [Pyrinomonadaceae bacterium]
MNNLPAFAFFDIGDTLATVRVSPDGLRIAEFTVLPGVIAALEELRAENGLTLGILSNRGSIPEKEVLNALNTAGILEFFEPSFIIFGKKDTVRFFKKIALTARGGFTRKRQRGVAVRRRKCRRAFPGALGRLSAG